MNAVIAQYDAVTAYGWGMDVLWNGLLSGQTAIRSTDRFDQRGFVSDQAAFIPDLVVEPDESRVMAMLKRILSPLIGKIDPLTPLILATTVGEIEYIERAILDGRPDLASEARPQALLGRIKHLLELRGTGMVISSACASSATAMTHAASLIRRGDHKRVLVVACDAVSEFVYSGFSTLLSLSAIPAQPFDAQRSGLTLGEAAAWTMLVSDDKPIDGLGQEAASILGWGNAADAIHMTAPDRDARGLSRAIAKACSMAKRSAAEISFIAAHGTATVYNDAMELRAFRSAIGHPIPIFSIKGGVGHSLAPAGMLQILVAIRAMSQAIVPPTVGLVTPDPLAVNWARPSPTRVGQAPLALSTNSGFGGVNTAILLGKGNQA